MKQQCWKLGLLLCCSLLLLTGCHMLLRPSTTKLTTASNIPDQPQRIALLIPVTGPISNSAQAIRNGFLAAYYAAKDQQNYAPDITVFDTQQTDTITLYQQAVQQGAQVVVGPLTKENVQTLITMGKFPVPVVALNSVTNNRPLANLYEFDLSPETEAVGVAKRAWQDGHRRALLIAGQDLWQQHVAQALMKQWQTEGGEIAATLAYRPQGNPTVDIANLLGVNPHFNRDKRGRKIDATPHRRQDVDVIFLITTPSQAALINPLLKFYFAGDLPVYAPSLVYSSSSKPSRNQDLDGITFSDMPWVLDSPAQLPPDLQQIRTRIETLWPDAFQNNPRLYALGIDAYQLATHFNQLLINSSNYKGATGILILQSDNTIHRQLDWAKMQNGYPQLLP